MFMLRGIFLWGTGIYFPRILVLVTLPLIFNYGNFAVILVL